jgi:glycosyltransferase XagB
MGPQLRPKSDDAAGLVPTAAPRIPIGEQLATLGLLKRETIPAILRAQLRWGCRFGEAAIAEGAVSPAGLAEALSESENLALADLIADPPDTSLCRVEDIDIYLQGLFLPWRQVGDAVIVACADPSTATRNAIRDRYGPRALLAVTSKFDVVWTVQSLFRDTLARDASLQLDQKSPEFSARQVLTRAQLWIAVAAALLVVAAFLSAPVLTVAVFLTCIGFFYAANIVLRGLLFAAGRRGIGLAVSKEEIAGLSDRELPTYTIIAPLHREAHMVGPLVRALKGLDYPAAKLDIKLALEEDDTETIAAAKAARLDGRFEILRVPPGTPRTKPRACNYALRFARGAYTVIYDAEDRPEPDQLKKAAAAFRRARSCVACFQARLNVYNADENWLTRMFALEYAAWFDFLLPGLARLGIPIPLGGTSNHFRTQVLRDAGGWDAFNVTEDADLGIRLARQGLAVIPLDSTTYEEAVPGLRGWVRQRSRWIKGYMQTTLVHLRRPSRFAKAVGIGPFAGFVLFVGGAAATNLLSPIVWLLALLLTFAGNETILGSYGGLVAATSYFSLLAGNGLLTLLAILAPFKRGWRHLAPYGATVCLYWVLISAAAYKALWQLARCPFYWEKTDHGVSLSGTRETRDMAA